MKSKGQALIEFILVMPIFIFIALAVFDFGNIIVKKYQLENDIDTIATMYEEKKDADATAYATKIDAKLTYNDTGTYNEISLSKRVNIITPILRQAMGRYYEINTKRTVLKNEKE